MVLSKILYYLVPKLKYSSLSKAHIYLGGCAQKRATQAAAGIVSYSLSSLRNLIAVS